ncbi:hypothetical protein QQF64_000250 [Cirrhinus molitorella]|uniref:DUF659 domain-containing protein n=1 Tax=Cirrhinus molitorella TaxID=172907 RepID=A0ABR3NWM8_9TELE
MRWMRELSQETVLHQRNVDSDSYAQYAIKDPYLPNSIPKKRLDNKLLKMMVKDMQPYNIVNDEGFREFVYALDPRFPQRHTADEIAAALHEIFRDFNIENKVGCVVTDNAANMVAAVKKLVLRHMPCFAHTLNLIVKDGLSAVAELTER